MLSSSAFRLDRYVQERLTTAMNEPFMQFENSMPEQENFADSVARHLPFLTRVIRRLVHSDYMLEDLVQQTALKALSNAHQFRFESTLKTWLTSIAINEVYQQYRCAWHRRAVSLTPEMLATDLSGPVDVPHTSYEVNQRALAVRDAVSRLPKGYRRVVELCDFQCLSLAEAARRLGLTLSAVKSRRHRARQKLLRLVGNFSD